MPEYLKDSDVLRAGSRVWWAGWVNSWAFLSQATISQWAACLSATENLSNTSVAWLSGYQNPYFKITATIGRDMSVSYFRSLIQNASAPCVNASGFGMTAQGIGVDFRPSIPLEEGDPYAGSGDRSANAGDQTQPSGWDDMSFLDNIQNTDLSCWTDLECLGNKFGVSGTVAALILAVGVVLVMKVVSK